MQKNKNLLENNRRTQRHHTARYQPTRHLLDHNAVFACRSRISGFTLIELLIALAISAVTLSFALPAFDQIMSRTKTTSAINRLIGAVNITRHTAVTFQSMTTLCALKPNGQCGANWAGTLTVFLDKNHNAQLEQEDTIIKRVAPVSEGTQVSWRAFQNKRYLQMTPRGYTNFQNGNFVVCHNPDFARDARQLVINVQGRTRINRRVNQQGWPIDGKGRVLKC